MTGTASPCFAGMTWPARAIDPSLISAVKSDSELLDELLFGEPPTLFTERLKNDGRIDLGADKALLEEFPAELYWYVPEEYHKRIIGVQGKTIQRIMKHYSVYVKFFNALEFAERLGNVRRQCFIGGVFIERSRGFTSALEQAFVYEKGKRHL